MHLDHRAYEGPDDFLRLLAFLSETNALDPTSGRLQPGDLTWWTRQNMAFSPQRSLQLGRTGCSASSSATPRPGP